MKQKGRCYVEINSDGVPIRIFRNRIDAVLSPANKVDKLREWPRRDAVAAIRKQVFERSQGECERCSLPITEQTGEMDERVSRGEGGEMSIFNSWFICHDCHTGSPFSEHGERNWGGKLKF